MRADAAVARIVLDNLLSEETHHMRRTQPLPQPQFVIIPAPWPDISQFPTIRIQAIQAIHTPYQPEHSDEFGKTMARPMPLRFCALCGAPTPPWRDQCASHDLRRIQSAPRRIRLRQLTDAA